MRWSLLVTALLLVVPEVQTRTRTRTPGRDGENRRGKRKRDGPGPGLAKGGRSGPQNLRLGPDPVLPEPAGTQRLVQNPFKDLQEQRVSYDVITDSDLSGDPPAPGDLGDLPGDPVTPLSPEEVQRLLWREEEEHRQEEERLRRKDEARRKRRRQRKEQEERQRRIVEEKRREEEEAQRRQLEREEEEWRRKIEEEETRRREEEEDRRRKEVAEREARERERKLEEERRRREELLREELRREEEQEEEQEEEVWLRGDVFQMMPKEEQHLLPPPIPRPPAATQEGAGPEGAGPEGAGLPPGCDISDVIVSCENAKLSAFPAIRNPEIKAISLEGNDLGSVPAGAFSGLPNLEWINLKKNALTSAAIHAHAFRGLKALKRLYLDGNLLDVVPADLPPTLQELKISENRLAGIDHDRFHGLGSLVILELEGNLLSEGNVDPRAFGPLTQLCYLRLGRNHFRTIPQGLPGSLLELHMENNLIEEISETVFNQTQNLNLVSLRHNKLDESRIAPLAWIHHRNLESIDLSHNQLYLVPSYLPRSLVHLVLVGNQIQRIPGFVFAHLSPGLEYLYLSFNRLDGEGAEPEAFYGAYDSLVEACLDHNQLLDVPAGLNRMTNLHFLRLDHNSIRGVSALSLCNPDLGGSSAFVNLRLDNNLMEPHRISDSAFSCLDSASSLVITPQRKP